MITDELREWTRNHTVNCSDNRIALTAIADCIDAEHESKVSYWQGASYKDGYDDGFASADDYFTGKRETLKEHGWVKLPLDADGEVIHIGDSIEIIGGEYGTVVAIELCEDGGWNVSMRPTGWDTPTLFAAECVRHHHPPTVEDVLEEFAQMYIACNDKGTIAEYAAKLRLVEEDV